MKVSHDNIETFVYTPGKYFVIPDFQRPYSWENENINSFLEDLEYAIDGKKTHFFGSIVFINDGENKMIIDGQQRVTTVLIMLTALYHIIKTNPKRSLRPANQIKDQYLYNDKSYHKENNRIKLRTVSTDNKIFESIFEQNIISEKQKASRLYQAYRLFINFFENKDNLDKYLEALSMFEIVIIALDSSDDNPQKIFESINSTGKPLSDGDKIRNFALMLNNHEAREFVLKSYWTFIETKLTKGNQDFISDFFKYYLTSVLHSTLAI